MDEHLWPCLTTGVCVRLQMFVGLSKARFPDFQRTEHAFTTWHMRFLQRFRSFQHLPTPQPLAFEDFQAACNASDVQVRNSDDGATASDYFVGICG